MSERSTARVLLETLRNFGVDTLFGIISSHTMEIFDALYDLRDDFRFIGARHEHAAAMMADGYARVTGRPGVVLTSTGPGAANSMGGMGEAYFASSPLLNITSTAEEPLYERGLGTIHETKNQLGMFESVTRHCYHVSRPGDVVRPLCEAFELFHTARPQPIAIQIPVDVQRDVAEVAPGKPARTTPPGTDTALVSAAAELLLSGSRVGVLAGTGVHRAGAHQALTRLVETLQIPVFTTANGKGAISERSPLCLGMFGGEYDFPPGGLEDPRLRFANSLDTLLVVGSSMSYFRVQSQGLRQPPHLIHLDIDPESIGKWYDVEVSLVGHAGVVLEQLNDAVAGRRAQLEDGFAAEIEVVRDDIRDFKKRTMPGETKIMQTIRDVVADDAIFVGDVSICNHRGSNYCLEIYGERSYMIPAWGGLGFGLPAAIGAKAAFPDRQVICITGDGGLQFNIQEFATCVQYGISPVVIVFNDSAWGLLRQFQSARSERYIASDLRNPDFFQLTEAYGAAGWRVASLRELRPALEAACASPALAVVDVQTPDGFARFA